VRLPLKQAARLNFAVILDDGGVTGQRSNQLNYVPSRGINNLQ
jgi:hypothetical protein